MILSDDEIKERIESPLNLLNRLKSSLGSTTSQKHIHTPCLPPKSSEIIDDLENKIKDASLRSKAVGILTSAMDELSKRIPEVQKAEKLASIAAEMSKVISHQDSKNTGDKMLSQIIVYAPQVQSLESYEVIDVAE